MLILGEGSLTTIEVNSTEKPIMERFLLLWAVYRASRELFTVAPSDENKNFLFLALSDLEDFMDDLVTLPMVAPKFSGGVSGVVEAYEHVNGSPKFSGGGTGDKKGTMTAGEPITTEPSEPYYPRAL